jgi:hypothetical protein
MRRLLLVGTGLLAIVILVVGAHMALIEVGRDVITLRTQRPDGSWQSTRLWIVDDGPVAWLHSGGAAWQARFANDPIVEVVRSGHVVRYRAHAVPGPHPRVDALLRQKYGIADRWVRFIAPDNADTLAVRLDPLETPGKQRAATDP